MSKLKTVLIVFVAFVLADNAFSQLRRPGSLRRPGATSTAAQEEEYWSSWPATLSNEERITLLHETEKKYSVVILGGGTFGGTTNTWHKGEGKSLIEIGDDFVRKMDQDGSMISCGRRYCVTELDEIKWYNAEMEKRLAPLQKSWAEKHGMTLEDAMRKYKEWDSSRPRPAGPRRLLNFNNRPGGRPGLSRPGLNHEPGSEIARVRREERLKQQQAEAEQQRQAAEQAKKEREHAAAERELAAEERKAQLEQLMQIQEELRRQREEQIRREHENGRP